MATATAERARRANGTPTADTTVYERGEDGHEVRYEEVDGELVPFSLAPYPESARPVYWCPRPGIEMRFRAREKNHLGFHPMIQRERWIDGRFSPRNAWEEHMTREWLKQTITGANPDAWKGSDHPRGEGHGWRCECGFLCPNWAVFEQHQRLLAHTQMRSE